MTAIYYIIISQFWILTPTLKNKIYPSISQIGIWFPQHSVEQAGSSEKIGKLKNNLKPPAKRCWWVGDNLMETMWMFLNNPFWDKAKNQPQTFQKQMDPLNVSLFVQYFTIHFFGGSFWPKKIWSDCQKGSKTSPSSGLKKKTSQKTLDVSHQQKSYWCFFLGNDGQWDDC